MVVIRNVFQLKFGKAREALALVKEGVEIQKRAFSGVEFSNRVLTDITGPFYTLVLELTVPSLGEFENLDGLRARVRADPAAAENDGAHAAFAIPAAGNRSRMPATARSATPITACQAIL